MTTMEQIQNALTEALKQHSFTQAELAEKIGVTQSMISHYVSGRKMPALDTLSRLCTVLDLDANEILCVERPKMY
ncbi:MAG: helix-turn-helix transcriptional regulator [Clostridia bacterium]|nr:helix-turn-helix transcriptional regulator [Clostridia bacterium]